MNKKSIRYLYFYIVLTAFLAACGSQNAVLPTMASTPTVLPPTSIPPTAVSTSTLIPATLVPTPLPTEPVFPVITPDPIQIERWNEYEDALAMAFFKGYFRPEDVVCEWEILEQTDREVYVWAYCSGIYAAGPSAGSIPTVIHLRTDGSVQSAEIPGSGTAYGPDIRRMFPQGVQERIFNHLISFQGLDDRMRWRRGHPDEPPLIILNSLSTQPTPAVIPWITPDSIQVENWMEYQSALAKSLLSYLSPEQVLCEWEILGRSGNEIYVWAACGEMWDVRVGLEGLIRIDVAEDGSVQNAVPSGTGGMGFPSEIRKMFPRDVQERYFSGLIHFQELADHLRWRLRHPQEPPLIVSGLTSTPCPGSQNKC
jgi:hypothetical protein